MGTLYIDKKDCHLKLDGDAIAFYRNGLREGIVPINPLKRVIVVGNVTMDTQVLNRLADGGICVVFLSGRRLHFRGMLWGRLHKNAMARLKQYERSLDRKFVLGLSGEFVLRKIQGQIELLEDGLKLNQNLSIHFRRAFEAMERISGNIKSGCESIESLRGHEGAASAVYFSVFPMLFPDSLQFKNRNKRPPRDPVNAMLSLCYTKLHYEIVREILVAGLDPLIGFYHQFEYGRESLSCDLVEVFRPSVDRFVWDCFRERRFSVRDFVKENEGVYLKKMARKAFYPIYENWADPVRKEIEKEIRDLLERIGDGKNTLPG